MTMDSVIYIMNSGINVVIMASMPCIGLGLLIGLIIAIFQAVTQIQEQTLTFVPKMLAVFLMLSMMFPWMARLVMGLATEFWETLPFYGVPR